MEREELTNSKANNKVNLIRQALDLVVQAYNVGELPNYLKMAIQDVAEDLAAEIDMNIQFGGGNLYTTESEDENVASEPINELEISEEELGEISIIDEY